MRIATITVNIQFCNQLTARAFKNTTNNINETRQTYNIGTVFYTKYYYLPVVVWPIIILSRFIVIRYDIVHWK